MSERVDLAEFLSAYVAETDEQLTAASSRLLGIEAALKKNETSPRAVRDLFRALHTIKGLSAMVGVEAVVTIAHKMESVLRAADRAGGVLASGAVDALLEGVRAIEQRVRALEAGRVVAAPEESLLRALDALEESRPTNDAPSPARELHLPPQLASKLAPFEIDQLLAASGEGRRALRVDFAPSAERAAAGLSINSVRERVAAIADIVKVMPLSVPASDSAPGGLSFVLLLVTAVSDADIALAAGGEASDVTPLVDLAELPPAVTVPTVLARADALAEVSPEPSAREEDSQRRNVLRVDVARVDEAMERLAALIVTRSRLAAAIAAVAASGTDTRELKQIALENARQLRDLRSAILRVRMVPIMEILERVPLILRALKRASGKQVRLAIEGGETELDKAVAERIFPAVVHLVRNAIDHGMETPAERRAAGKPEEGVLRISCSARSNTRLELIISDDGRGIDRKAIATRARREAPDTDSALLDLLCQPGFSTREEATTTSGRGMGMDIVRRIVVDQLGGEVLLHSEPGRGTTFTLHVPLTIAIIDAFTLECGSQRFVVPVSAVEEIVEIDAPAVVFTPITTRARDGERLRMIQRRGEAVPLIDLATLLGLPGARREAKKALVIRRAGQPLAFGIERVLGQQEAVVRPLVDALVNVRGVSGATDLGDGRPTLVLDFVALASTSAPVLPRARGGAVPALLEGAS